MLTPDSVLTLGDLNFSIVDAKPTTGHNTGTLLEKTKNTIDVYEVRIPSTAPQAQGNRAVDSWFQLTFEDEMTFTLLRIGNNQYTFQTNPLGSASPMLIRAAFYNGIGSSAPTHMSKVLIGAAPWDNQANPNNQPFINLDVGDHANYPLVVCTATKNFLAYNNEPPVRYETIIQYCPVVSGMASTHRRMLISTRKLS